MLLITDNTNVESRTRSLVKYIINNITITALTGLRKTDTYLHLVRGLLYKIDWPSGRQLYILEFCARIGILCARYLYSVIESTPSPWDSGSWIESTPSSWNSGSRIDTLGGFHQRVSRRMLVIWTIRDTEVRWVYQLLDAEMTALGSGVGS